MLPSVQHSFGTDCQHLAQSLCGVVVQLLQNGVICFNYEAPLLIISYSYSCWRLSFNGNRCVYPTALFLMYTCTACTAWLVVWKPLCLDPSDGVFGRFDLAALCGCHTLNVCCCCCTTMLCICCGGLDYSYSCYTSYSALLGAIGSTGDSFIDARL